MKIKIEQKNEEKNYRTVLIGALVFVFLAPIMSIIIFQDYKKNPSPWLKVQELGPVGDYLAGTMVPVLTFSGFIVLVLSTMMQRQELILTRKELSETRKIIDAQSKTMSLERFENTFFHLLSLHNEIVKGITITDPIFPVKYGHEKANGKFNGRETFPIYKQILFETFFSDEQFFTITEDDIDGLHQQFIYLKSIYLKYLSNNNQELGHYFRNLHSLLKFIDDSTQLNEKEKREYVNLVKSQLSNDEQILILYNCLSPEGETYFPYLKKYELLTGVLNKVSVHDEVFLKIYSNFNQVKQRDNDIKELSPIQ